MKASSIGHGLRAIVLSASATLAGLSGALLLPGPVAACSCMMPGPLERDATTAVFTGVVGPLDQRGVPVAVDHWFWGAGAGPVVYLGASSFGDSASCGTQVPVAGSAWIWVAWRSPDGGDLVTGLCQRHAQLDTEEGRALLAEAVATFGEPVITRPPPTIEPAASEPTADAGPLPAVAVVAAIGVVVVALFGGITFAARRSSS